MHVSGHQAALARLLLLAATATAGCVYDSAETCGPHMRFNTTSLVCTCDDASVAGADGCTPCAADEVAVDNACTCPMGMAKVDGVCSIVAGLGDPCDASTPCDDPTYSYCAIYPGAAAGYCTSPCVADADCQPSYTCATWEAQPYCRTFTGNGASCASSPDCADFDATLCLPGQNVCAIAGCNVETNDCPRDSACCDLSAYGIGSVCVPEGTCP